MYSGGGPQPVAHGQPVVAQPVHGYAGGPPMAQQPVVPLGSGSWQNGLCDCGAPDKCDCATCAMATFCPWGMRGATAKLLRSGQRYDAFSGRDAPARAISARLYTGRAVLSRTLNAYVAHVVTGV